MSNSKEDLEKLRMRGEGGAPTRASSLPTDAQSRKNFPIASGVLDYFPDAIVAISEISQRGNDQHNPGMSLRWTRSKSGDEADTCIRHFLQRGTLDTDGVRHTAKAAWRLLALLQKEIEQEQDNSLKTPIIINESGTLIDDIDNTNGTIRFSKNLGWQNCNCEDCLKGKTNGTRS